VVWRILATVGNNMQDLLHALTESWPFLTLTLWSQFRKSATDAMAGQGVACTGRRRRRRPAPSIEPATAADP
jgi:hypothetical protein